MKKIETERLLSLFNTKSIEDLEDAIDNTAPSNVEYLLSMELKDTNNSYVKYSDIERSINTPCGNINILYSNDCFVDMFDDIDSETESMF